MTQAICLCALKDIQTLMHEKSRATRNCKTFRVNFGTNSLTDACEGRTNAGAMLPRPQIRAHLQETLTHCDMEKGWKRELTMEG